MNYCLIVSLSHDSDMTTLFLFNFVIINPVTKRIYKSPFMLLVLVQN